MLPKIKKKLFIIQKSTILSFLLINFKISNIHKIAGLKDLLM
jgi:hypothetical protein